MALTVTENLTLVSACDSITGWSGGTRLELDTDVKIQNTGCLAQWIDAMLSPLCSYAISSTDMSNGEHVYVWMYCSGVVETQANGGYRIYASDGTNDSTWYVGGNDTHGSGWQLMVVSLDATPDIANGTLNTAAITSVGVYFNTITDAVQKGQTFIMNCFFDVVRYGTGLTITSGVSDAITMEDIYDVDNASANKFGVIQKSAGAYVLNGGLVFGNTGSDSVDAVIDGEVLLYPDNPYVGTSFNTIQALGNSTGETNLDISGSFIKANNVPLIFEVDNTDVDVVSVVGSTIINASAVSFADGQTCEANVFTDIDLTDIDNSPLNCTWNASGLIALTVNGVMDAGNIFNSTGAVSVSGDNLSDVDGSTFLSDGSNHAFELNTYVASMTWDALTTGYETGATGSPVTPTSTGNEDIYINCTSSSDITINVASGATIPSIRKGASFTGDVNVVAGQVPVTVIVEDINGDPIEDARVRLFDTATKAVIYISDEVDVDGEVTTNVTYSTDVPVSGWVRQMDTIGTEYVPKDISGTIGSAGLLLTVVLEEL